MLHSYMHYIMLQSMRVVSDALSCAVPSQCSESRNCKCAVTHHAACLFVDKTDPIYSKMHVPMIGRANTLSFH